MFLLKIILKNNSIYWLVAAKMKALTQFPTESGNTGRTVYQHS